MAGARGNESKQNQMHRSQITYKRYEGVCFHLSVDGGTASIDTRRRELADVSPHVTRRIVDEHHVVRGARDYVVGAPHHVDIPVKLSISKATPGVGPGRQLIRAGTVIGDSEWRRERGPRKYSTVKLSIPAWDLALENFSGSGKSGW